MSEANLGEKYVPRFLKLYKESVVPAMKEKFGYKNVFSVPYIKKIVINMGVGEATSDAKIIDKASEELGVITGQKPKVCRASKAISNFKLRKGVPIGCCVTLRKSRMYEFFDRLITVAIPRIRDFRGLPPNSFDKRGNYTFGLSDQSIFPELNIDKITKARGMNISINTSANTDEEAKELLLLFGFPFRR